MTRLTPDALFDLLPAIYRNRDGENGPLRALMMVLAEQGRLLERDIERLYDNAFIETCDEWAVPYLGDLLGVRNLHGLGEVVGFSQRSRVANALAYRRRKGTATMLEQLARDTTGWPARAVEFFEHVATTQHINHPRLHNHRAPDLRRSDVLDRIDTPFDTVAHTADVRRIASGRGLHNIPNVGVFLWRLQAYPLEATEARPVTDPPDGRYWLHPYGLDAPLFNEPQTETEITHLAEEVNVPAPLRRRPLYEELVARREAFRAEVAPDPVYFGSEEQSRGHSLASVVGVVLDGEVLRPEQILICDLSNWTVPGSEAITDRDGETMQTRVSIDPVLGRLVTLGGPPGPSRVEVGHAYGFPGDVGGGPYDRQASLADALPQGPTWSARVSKAAGWLSVPEVIEAENRFGSLEEALHHSARGWHTQPAGAVGVITVEDGSTYAESLVGPNRIRIPEGSRLVIAAGTRADDGTPRLTERRAHLLTDVVVEGIAPPTSTTPGVLALDGFLIEGEVRVIGSSESASLGGLRVAHCTVGLQEATSPRGVTVGGSASANRELVLDIDHSLCGRISAPETIGGIRLRDTVVQGRGYALAETPDRPGPPASIERCTLFGRVHVREISLGSETLFTEPVIVERLQSGCVRFSYVPSGSRTPRRFRCQPDLALRKRAEALRLGPNESLPLVERTRILGRLRPSFTAVRYGEPALAQLAERCAGEIRTGAEDGSEMGVWSHLKQPQRLANLNAGLEDYLRFGLEAGVLFVT
ncbi:MAG: hypothetical protein AAGI52_00400 [Bacteroidota bacterium]